MASAGADGHSISPADLDRIDHDLRRLRVGDRESPVVVGVSGGADSLGLLLLAHAALGEQCLAATVDHELRTGSADEAEHVARICAERGICHVILRGAMKDRVGRTRNLSHRARELRYRLLEEYRVAAGAGWIATAHHAEDQLETLIMRLNRGAGVGGLGGIRETSGRVIRPVLEWRRATLVRIVTDAGVRWIGDPTNEDERYDRARLRKELGRIDWLDPGRVAYSAHNLQAADEALSWAADRLLGRFCLLEADSALYRWTPMPKELQRRIVRRCILHVDPNADCGKLPLTRLQLALLNEEKATLGKVLCEPKRRLENGRAWREWVFRPAPPRRMPTPTQS